MKRHKVEEKTNYLSIVYKRILKTDPQKRTKIERKNLETLFEFLPCFQYYSPVNGIIDKFNCFIEVIYLQLMRRKLTNITHFQFFERGRVLLKEGHYPSAMYFILSGEVVISKWIYSQVILNSYY